MTNSQLNSQFISCDGRNSAPTRLPMLEPRPDGRFRLTPDRSGFIRVFDAYLTRRADSNVGRARNAAPRTIHHVELRHTPHGGPSLSQPLEHGRSSSCTRCVCLYHHYSLLELLRCVFPRHRTLCRNPFLIHTHIHVDQVLTHVCDISTYRIPVQFLSTVTATSYGRTCGRWGIRLCLPYRVLYSVVRGMWVYGRKACFDQLK